MREYVRAVVEGARGINHKSLIIPERFQTK
jgi:hypothetical protein